MADSTTLAQELADAQQRAEQLQERLTELDSEIETKRSALGKAMALGDSETKLKGIKKALRDAEDEKEGAERGLVFLAQESERLERELASAKATEAAADRDTKVDEAVAAIDELAEALSEWLGTTLLPLVSLTDALSADAYDAEKRAAQLTAEGVRGSRLQELGWERYPGLAGAVSVLRKLGTHDRLEGQ